ncbi:hypothetical protein AMJ80_12550 [bacterium SM23_31]|nr:MAG: hypothetical protein AMJ80_12550 [bacterium SM23_31]
MDIPNVAYMPFLTGILITLSFFTLLILIIFVIHRNRVRHRELIHKERLALIEKGVTEFPDEFRKGVNLHLYMAWGFVFSGFGLALIIGLMIIGDWEGIIGGLIFLFIGLALLLFYKIQSKKEEAKNLTGKPRD